MSGTAQRHRIGYVATAALISAAAPLAIHRAVLLLFMASTDEIVHRTGGAVRSPRGASRPTGARAVRVGSLPAATGRQPEPAGPRDPGRVRNLPAPTLRRRGPSPPGRQRREPGGAEDA